MASAIFFQKENNESNIERCVGNTYFDFIDFAFSKSDYFLLVYINHQKKGYSNEKKYFKDKLNKFKVKSIVDWPGLVEDISGADYKMIIYRADDEAKQILKEVDALSDWSGKNPEYLAFFKGQKCWFYSASLIGVAAIINPDNLDFEFIEKHGLSHRKNRYTIDGNSFLSGDLDNLF